MKYDIIHACSYQDLVIRVQAKLDSGYWETLGPPLIVLGTNGLFTDFFQAVILHDEK